MFRAIHISDLHNKKECEPKLAYIKDHFPRHHIIVTGDITDDGEPGQYLWAMRELVKRFRDKLFIVPGNHDYAGLGNLDSKDKMERFDDYFGTRFSQVAGPWWKRHDNVLLIGLDSNPRTWLWPGDFARGKIGKEQRKNLKLLLDVASADHIFICLHHHLKDPSAVGWWTKLVHKLSKELMELEDSKKVCRLLSTYKHITVLHGHRHSQYEYSGEYAVKVFCAGALFKEDNVLKLEVDRGGSVEYSLVPVVKKG